MTYTIDPSRSEFVVRLFKAGVGAAFAHDHVVRATRCTGQIQGDPADPTTASIVVEVDASSLRVDEPEVRRKYGLTTVLTDKERRDTQTAMESPSQLDVVRYRTICFRSTRVTQRTGAQYVVTGDVTIRGVTRSVTFPATGEHRDDAMHGQGSFRLKQSSFGYQPYSALLGAIRNQDDVELHFDVLATPA